MKGENQYFQNQVKSVAKLFNAWLNTYKGEFQNEKSRFCEVYDLFTENSSPDEYEGHNCIACNLEEGAYYLNTFLQSSKDCDQVSYYVTVLTTLMNLEVERVAEIYKELGYKTTKGEFDWASFPELQRIKYWANLFKHPKAYMFLHHPSYHITSDPDKPNFMIEGVIDDEFVKKFYAGWKRNEDLRTLLSNKQGYKVFFPDLVEFVTSFTVQIENLIALIKGDQNHVEKLRAFTVKDFIDS